jgi:recombination protein RecT
MANENTSMQTRPQAQVPAAASPAANIRDLIERAQTKIASVVPRHLTAERLTRVAIACITRTPALLACSPPTLLQAVMQAAELGLEPGSALGEAYLVPYGKAAQLIVGYRGLIALARRSGQIEDIEAHVVREGDHFKMTKGIHQVLEHEPALDAGEPAPLRLVYAMAWLKGSTRPHVEVMTKAEIDKVRARSKASGSGPWVSDYEEMSRKTVVRRLVKYLPMSVEMARASEVEQADDVDAIDVVAVETPAPAAAAGSRFKERVTAAAAPKAVDFPMDEAPPADDPNPPRGDAGIDG